MNENVSVMTYRFALLCFLLLQLSNGIIYAQEKVKASDAFQQGGQLVIKVVIPALNAPCFSIQRVELVDLTTKTKIVAKSLEGVLKNLPAGTQQFLWNYKKDNVFLDSQYDVFVYLDPCPLNKVKALDVFQQDDYLAIKVAIPASNTPCFSIQQVELVDLTTKTKIVAKSLEGALKNLHAGNQQFLWNYKKDNIFLDSQYDVFVYLDACPINETPKPVAEVEVKKEAPTPKTTKVVPSAIPEEEKRVIPESSKGSSRIALKLLVGGTGIITAVMANSIKSSFDSKVETLTTLNNTLTQVNGQFTSQSDLDTWNSAYANAKAAQQTGLLNALVAGSVLSLAYEVYLLTSKPKKMTTTRKMSLSPSSDYTYNTGLSLTYHF